MAEILLNTRPQHTNALFANSAFADKDWQQQFYRNNRSIVADILQPYQPYMLNGGQADTHDFYNQMCTIPQQQREVIGHTVESIGPDNTLALAAMYDEHIYPYLKEDGSTLSGALAGALASSRNGLMESMSKYEKALLQIYEARKQGATPVGTDLSCCRWQTDGQGRLGCDQSRRWQGYCHYCPGRQSDRIGNGRDGHADRHQRPHGACHCHRP